MKVSKQQKRTHLFHALYSVSKLKEDELWHAARTRFELELAMYVRRRYVNGIGTREAICTAAARHFGVTPRSMQRLWSAFYGPQRPRAKSRRR